MPTRRAHTYLLLVCVVVIWASYPALIKVALQDMPPFTLAALRCTLASTILLALLWRSSAQGEAPITRADWPGLVFLGLVGFTGSTGIIYLAVALTTASNAVILTCSTPVFVALGGHLFFGERLTGRQWTGVAVSALGVLLTVTRGELRVLEAPPHLGDGIVVAGQVLWATYTLYGKRVLVRLSPRVATTAAYVVGTAGLIPVAVLLAPAFPPADYTSLRAWGVVLFQGTLGTLSHVWYYRGVQAVGPAVTAMFINLQPLVGLLLTTGLLGERLAPAQAGGALLILAGVWLVTRRSAWRHRLQSSPAAGHAGGMPAASRVDGAWIDVTVPIHGAMVVYEGDPPVQLVSALALDRGDPANVARLTLGSHTGTHVDAPAHFIAGGTTVDRLAPELLVGPVRVVACPAGPVGPEVLAAADLGRERRLILKTANSGLWREPRFVRDYQALTLPAARALVAAGVELVGIDYLSIEGFGAPGHPVHRCLLEAGVVIVEGLDLAAVAPGRYEMLCLPLRIQDGDGAPARVLLRPR